MGFFTRNRKDEGDVAGRTSSRGSGSQAGVNRRRTAAGGHDEAAADELRRRARRRLVGAIAMVLAAVIVLPMLLDAEREPLPETVAIQIPARNLPFEPNLTPALPGESASGTTPDAQRAADMPPPVAGSEAVRPPASLAVTQPPAAPAQPETTSEPKPAPEPAKPPVAAAKPAPPPPPPVTRTPPPNAAAAKKEEEAARALALLQGKPAPPRASSAAQAPATRYAVQVVAVRSREGADNLLSTLRGAGLAAYIETIKTPDGQVHRVRLGPFDSKSQAESAQARLRGLPGGHNGSLVPL